MWFCVELRSIYVILRKKKWPNLSLCRHSDIFRAELLYNFLHFADCGYVKYAQNIVAIWVYNISFGISDRKCENTIVAIRGLFLNNL